MTKFQGQTNGCNAKVLQNRLYLRYQIDLQIFQQDILLVKLFQYLKMASGWLLVALEQVLHQLTLQVSTIVVKLIVKIK